MSTLLREHSYPSQLAMSTHPLGIMHDAVVVVVQAVGGGNIRTLLGKLPHHVGPDVLEHYPHVLVSIRPGVLVVHSNGVRYFVDDHPSKLATAGGEGDDLPAPHSTNGRAAPGGGATGGGASIFISTIMETTFFFFLRFFKCKQQQNTPNY